jgi:broad specificity phosphatase PhoE
MQLRRGALLLRQPNLIELMKPRRIILVRHGESQGNRNPESYATIPDYALELTETGKEQAAEAGRRLKALIGDGSVFFYISPLWRTRMTFEQIAKSFDRERLRYREEPRIREQEWGHLRNHEDNENIDETRNAFGSFYYRIPEGESAADVYDRISDFFGTLHRDFEKDNFPENAIIVTHGMALRLFLMRWFHWTIEEFDTYANPRNCEYIVMESTGGKYALATELRRRPPQHKYQRPIRLDDHE